VSEDIWGPEWIELPSGSRLHRADLAKWDRRGCWKCGETVFNIYGTGDGVACPHCVRKRTKDENGNWRVPEVVGKFDMVAMRVTEVFKQKAREDHGSE
jgi:hypothetical protein